MASSFFKLLECIKSCKKLIVLVTLGYLTFLVYLYHGHAKISPPVVYYVKPGEQQESLQYVYRNKNSNNNSFVIDIHLEHPVLGHTGALLNRSNSSHGSLRNRKAIAIGGALTSAKVVGVTTSNIPQKFQVFTTLLPTFCQTASNGYEYHFYFAYDHTDGFFTKPDMLAAFHRHFQEKSAQSCKHLATKPLIHFVQCSHAKRPAWAQNDAMMEAYLDGATYFYRINDDSQLGSSGWVEAFIKVLSAYDPPNAGVVGPNHKGGNEAILTYDFVQRTHVDIFGFYYPRLFTDWWADDWVTKVYQPGRSTKLKSIGLRHTMRLGQRYKVDYSVGKKLGKQLQVDKVTLQRFIKAKNTKSAPPDGSKVISMSLFGKDPRYTMGAVRNAQLMQVYYPSWILRVYTVDNRPSSNPELVVPLRVLETLQSLGAEVAFVDVTGKTFDPLLFRYMVVEDPKVQTFLIRNADSRFTDREAEAVAEWEKSGLPFHCMRDHASHGEIVDGLWGAKNPAFRKGLSMDFSTLLQNNQHNSTLMLQVIWGMIRSQSYRHDGVACDTPQGSHKFPSPRPPGVYVGRLYNDRQQPLDVYTTGECLTGHGPASASPDKSKVSPPPKVSPPKVSPPKDSPPKLTTVTTVPSPTTKDSPTTMTTMTSKTT